MKNFSNDSELNISLWLSVKKGDRMAFENLYLNNIKFLLKYGYLLCNDQQLVEDAIQEVFISIWEKRKELSDVAAVQSYILKMLRNRIIRVLESKKNRKTYSLEELLSEIPYVVDDQNQEVFRKKELITQIRSLPPRQQEVIYLKYYLKLSNDKIADIMHMNYQSVSNLLNRAINKLKKLLSKNILE